jgi:hypothetical protein
MPKFYPQPIIIDIRVYIYIYICIAHKLVHFRWSHYAQYTLAIEHIPSIRKWPIDDFQGVDPAGPQSICFPIFMLVWSPSIPHWCRIYRMYVWMYVYICKCIYMCVCMYVCKYGWMDGWMDACMYVYIYICVYIYVYIYIYMWIWIYYYLGGSSHKS